MDVITEFFSSPAAQNWLTIIINGFFVGASVGAIIGVIVYSLTDRDGGGNLLLLVSGALIGLILGLFLAGEPLIDYLNSSSTSALRPSDAARTRLFGSIVGIMSWTVAGLALGCLVIRPLRSLWGMVMGAITGTVTAVILSQLRTQFSVTSDNPAVTMLIAVTTMILLVILAYIQRD